MHTIGKVFLVLTLLSALIAVPLTARLINTRNTWMKQVDAGQTAIERNQKQLQTAQEELDSVKAQLTNQRFAWDTMFLAQNSGIDQQGVLTVNIGPRQGFGVVPQGSPQPVVHAFAVRPDGSSVYAGPFRVVAAQGSQSRLEPTFPVFPADIANWKAQTWRLWQVIPSQAPSRVTALTNEIIETREALVARQDTLALQKKAVVQAKTALETRKKELFGDPQATPIQGSPEITVGLVAALQEADAARNKELAKLDELRRSVVNAYQRLTKLVAQNQGQLAKLSGGRPASFGPTLDVSDAR